MPAPKKNYTQAEYDSAFFAALSYCENYAPTEVADRMARDMLLIDHLKKTIDELSKKA